MSMVVLQTPFRLDNYCAPEPEEPFQIKDETAMVTVEDEEDHPAQSDIWSAIQAQKKAAAIPADASPAAPYVHPLVRRSSSSMSQESLLICTESLGSETGSDDFSAALDELDVGDYLAQIEADREEENIRDDQLAMKGEMWSETEKGKQRERKEIASVNYHCSIGKRSPARSFPPPLPSICCRNAPCLQMKPRRRDGRLMLDAVPAPSQNYLQAQREGGRLLLSFIDATVVNVASLDGASSDIVEIDQLQEQHQPIDEESSGQITEVEEAAENEASEQVLEDEEEDEDEEDEEEEVEVVDRGTVVEVKVSTQPQQQSGGAMKVLRSSLVINKFVGGAPISSNSKCEPPPPPPPEINEDIPSQLQNAAASPASRRPPPTTATTAAAVVVASSTISATAGAYGGGGGARLADGEDDPAVDNKMLFTSKRRNREELLHSMRRCSQLRRPLFIWEPYCIAT